MSSTAVANGANLKSRVATNGTVRLIVDHGEEHYEVRANYVYTYSDMREIMDYLREHDFEMLPEHEAPVEPNADGGFSIWCSHKQGLSFGFVEAELPVKVTIAGLVASVVLVLVQWLSEPMGVMTSSLVVP